MESPRVTTPLVLTALFILIGASAQFGLQIGVLNTCQTQIESALAIPKNSQMFSAGLVASWSLAAFAGAMLSPKIVDGIGRKRFTILNSILFVIGGGLAIISKYIDSHIHAAYAVLVIARLVLGIGSGAATLVAPMYLGEIAPVHLKGSFGTLSQLVITSALLLAQGVGVAFNKAGKLDMMWGWVVGGLPALLAMTVLILGPLLMTESPQWLAQHNRIEEAAAAVQKLRGYALSSSVNEELHTMSSGKDRSISSESEKVSVLSIFKHRLYRWPTIIACVLQTSQQMSGINAVFFYSNKFFADAGVSDPDTGTLLASGVNVVATLLSVWLIERAGRKKLLLVGSGGMLLFAVALTITLVIKSHHADLTSSLGVLSVVFVLLYVTMFELGLGAIPWMIGGEMLPEAPRATAMAIAAAFNWIFTTFIGLIFPTMQSNLGDFSFVPFAGCLIATLLFTIAFVPETAGRTPQQVLEAIHGRTALGGDEERVTARLLPESA